MRPPKKTTLSWDGDGGGGGGGVMLDILSQPFEPRSTEDGP